MSIIERGYVTAWKCLLRRFAGNGTTTDSSTPVVVSGITNATAIVSLVIRV